MRLALRAAAPRALVGALVLLLTVGVPSLHAAGVSSLHGSLFREGGPVPSSGDVILIDLGGPRRVATSPVSEQGAYRFENVAAGRYRIALDLGDTLYLLDSPVRLVAGASRRLDLSLQPQKRATDGKPGSPPAAEGLASVWGNPFYSTLIVVGVAGVVGVIVEDLTDDEVTQASPF